jgi:hypothetical protein
MKVSSSRYFFILNPNIVLRSGVAWGGGASGAVTQGGGVQRATKWAKNKHCI